MFNLEKLTFHELAIKVLKEANKPMTIDEIWRYSQERGYDLLVGSKGKTPWQTMSARIYVDMRDNPNSPFVKIDSKPKKFFLKDLQKVDAIKEEKVIIQPNETSYSERDLHPFLTYFVNTYLNAYTKTIYHEKSSKRTYSQWLHPDLVGVNFPIGEWEPEVLDFGLTLGSQLVKLYSFELKKELTFANIREAYFQAVSNSSWANEGYLVTAKVLHDEEFMTELKRLTSAFGIGIIKLDIEDPDATEILFPAKTKTEIDWETVNKLSKENPDFRKFIVRIKNDMNSKEIIKEKYDKVYTTEQLVGKIKKR
ncbi:COG2958 family protein [Bacillus smithii]|uniref:COG2958 family protein n=1 Tax=Bacillus smithii TaxID=1479 RepID=UPI003A521ED3